MDNRLTAPLVIIGTVLLCSCASTGTTVKQTWKSPESGGKPVGSVAVLAVDERRMVRVGLENRVAEQLQNSGQAFVLTHEVVALSDIKEDPDAAAKKLVEAGAEAVLITRTIANETQAHSFRVGPERYAPVVTGFGTGLPYYGAYDWYGYYTLAYQDMGTVWSSQSESVFLETSLFNLADGKLLWSCLTETRMKESADRLVEADLLAEKTVSALRSDGLVK